MRGKRKKEPKRKKSLAKQGKWNKIRTKESSYRSTSPKLGLSFHQGDWIGGAYQLEEREDESGYEKDGRRHNESKLRNPQTKGGGFENGSIIKKG